MVTLKELQRYTAQVGESFGRALDVHSNKWKCGKKKDTVEMKPLAVQFKVCHKAQGTQQICGRKCSSQGETTVELFELHAKLYDRKTYSKSPLTHHPDCEIC
ncbi:hypothetical protein ATANTOWER_003686 [Ataeniobius toweri]|uniref:Uncharacterized protein n=1 Tax=Ataeniobius toweri TaxID=208326 RepID=A0ABU7B4I9_9TELE|nr:hypothetical protein [Ataeniobius toweri]